MVSLSPYHTSQLPWELKEEKTRSEQHQLAPFIARSFFCQFPSRFHSDLLFLPSPPLPQGVGVGGVCPPLFLTSFYPPPPPLVVCSQKGGQGKSAATVQKVETVSSSLKMDSVVGRAREGHQGQKGTLAMHLLRERERSMEEMQPSKGEEKRREDSTQRRFAIACCQTASQIALQDKGTLQYSTEQAGAKTTVFVLYR